MKCKPISLGILSLLGFVFVSGSAKTQPQTLSVASALEAPKRTSLSKVPNEKALYPVYPSPNGHFFLTYDPKREHIILCDNTGKIRHQFGKFVGFCCSRSYFPWAQQKPICFLVQADKENHVKLLRYDVVHNRTGTFAFRGTVVGLVASPDGRYALVDAGVTVGGLATPLGPAQTEVLLLWDGQAPVNKLDPPGELTTFRLGISSLAWCGERIVFVHTAGQNLVEKPQGTLSAKTPLLVGENFLVSTGRGLTSKPLVATPYQSLMLAPYADAAGRLIGLAYRDRKHYLVSIDPTTGESHVEKELPASPKSPWLLTWSSPQRVYVWRWRREGEIEVYVYRSLATPHVGKGHVVEVPGPMSWTADVKGRLWWFDGKGLKSVQLPLE